MSGRHWTVEKLVNNLGQLINQKENLPVLTAEEKSKFGEFLSDAEATELIRTIFNKSEKSMRIYGTAEELAQDVFQSEHVYKFNRDSENQSFYTAKFMQSTRIDLYDDIYLSKNDYVLMIYQKVSDLFNENVHLVSTPDVCKLFTLSWLLMKCNVFFRGLEDCHEIIPVDTALVAAIGVTLRFAQDIRESDKDYKYEDFSQLRTHYDPDFQPIFDATMKKFDEMIKLKPIETNQEYYNKAYTIYTQSIRSLDEVFNKSPELLKPFNISPHVSMDRKPMVRLFNCGDGYYLFVREVRNALIVAMRNKRILDDFSKFFDEYLPLETKEERKLGIVNAIDLPHFNEIWKLLKLNEDKNLVVFSLEFGFTNWNSIRPLVSSYGKPCKEVFRFMSDLLFYLVNVLKVMRGANLKHVKKIYEWIEGLGDIYQYRNHYRFIEIWKCDEIINRAKIDLQKYNTEKVYEIPYKKEYTKFEVFGEFKKLCDGRLEAGFIANAATIIQNNKKELLKLQDIYFVYRLKLLTDVMMNVKVIKDFSVEHPKLEVMREDFANFGRKELVEEKKEEKQEFSGFKRGFFNKKPINDIPDKTIKHLLEHIHLTLAHCSSDQFQSIDFLQKVLEQQFRSGFDNETWNYLTTKILKNQELLKNAIGKYVIFEQKNEGILEFKKKKTYEIDTKFIEEIRESSFILNQGFKWCMKTSAEGMEHGSMIEEELRNMKIELEKLRKSEKLKDEQISKLEAKNEKLAKYENILKIDHKEMIDNLTSNLNKLSGIHPKSIEIQEAKLEVLKFEKYIEKVRKTYWKMRSSPDFEPDFDLEIVNFPDTKFLEKYKK